MNTEPTEASTNPIQIIHTSEAPALTSTRKYHPMPTNHEIEKARKNMTRHRFIEWLAKRTAASQADPSTAVEPFPIYNRSDRREADRKSPRPDGHRRLYKGDPARTEPYDTYRVTGASATKGPADYRKDP